jgi:hypothetical protein
MAGTNENDNTPDKRADPRSNRENPDTSRRPSIAENEGFAEIEVFEYQYADIEVKRSGPDKK